MEKTNKLIAEFMGVKKNGEICVVSGDNMHNATYEDSFVVNGRNHSASALRYHTSWSWLMPVLYEVEQVSEGVPQQMLHVNLYSEIGEVYQAIVEFINEYNLNVETMKENKIIAEFMGVVFHDDENQYYNEIGLYIGLELKYHTSWDWLMPVVKKIVRDVKFDIDYEDEYREHLMDVVPFAKIEDVYKSVVEFINECNKYICGSCGENCSEYTYNEATDVDECNDCKTINQNK